MGNKLRWAGMALLVLTGFFISGCNEPIPDKDLQAAKQAIAVAEAAKAKKYDPANSQKAKDNLKKALKKVAEESNGVARKAATQATKDAQTATENSRRALAADTIKEAETLISDAKANKASFLAKEQMDRANTKLKDAKDNFAKKLWLRSYTDAENAKEAAGKAKDEAKRKLAELKRAMDDADQALKRADSNPVVKKYAPKELADAKKLFQKSLLSKKGVDDPSSLSANDPALRNKLAKDAYDAALNSAKKAAADATNAIRLALQREQEAYRLQAEKKINEARKLIELIKKLKAKGLIKQSALPKNWQQISPPPAENNSSKTDSSDKKTAKKKDVKNSNKVKYNAALKALQRAEQTYQIKSYKNSIHNSEEAIRLAKLLLSMIKSGKFYLVRLIPAARDCLWRIASYKFIYGNASLWPRIWKANKHLIVDPDLIYPGQKFRIPPK